MPNLLEKAAAQTPQKPNTMMCDVKETLHLFAYSVASTCVKLLILHSLLQSHAAHEFHKLQIKEYNLTVNNRSTSIRSKTETRLQRNNRKVTLTQLSDTRCYQLSS